jgi:hypothetical protein
MPRSLLLLFLLIFTSFDQPKLVTKKLANGVSVVVPQDWRPMDGLDFSERYPSVRAPLAAYTNDERLADFSVNISATQWPDGNLKMASKFFKASVMNMFNRVEMIDEGTKEVHGKKFIFFEFESRVSGNRRDEAQTDPILKYTYMMYYVQPERTLVFSFNCPRRDREAWQPVAREMMGKVKIKK